MKHRVAVVIVLFSILLNTKLHAQLNVGGDGSDGPLIIQVNTNFNMSGRPSGIYQFTTIGISNFATVSFIPNANNTPVIWLVQSNVTIYGTINISGSNSFGISGGVPGPGGYAGGSILSPTGQGPGGGSATNVTTSGVIRPGNGSYADPGSTNCFNGPAGSIYGSTYLIPLLGGSGGAGVTNTCGSGAGGGGGGGAILIAANGQIQFGGTILAKGGNGFVNGVCSTAIGGDGSGGAVRFIADTIAGTGTINVSGGTTCTTPGGQGRVRFDTIQNNFAGVITNAVFTQGAQFVAVPGTNSGSQLYISSVAGTAVSATPGGVLINPDVFIGAAQTNPIPVTVQCSNVPLSTPITVTVTALSGPSASVTVSNTTGTASSSTATAQIHIPRGGGYLSATATLGN